MRSGDLNWAFSRNIQKRRLVAFSDSKPCSVAQVLLRIVLWSKSSDTKPPHTSDRIALWNCLCRTVQREPCQSLEEPESEPTESFSLYPLPACERFHSPLYGV